MKKKATAKTAAPKGEKAAKDGGEAAALEWFNRLSGRLQVELTEEPRPASERLLNLVAPPGAKVVGVALTLEVFENGDLRALTAEEWDRVVLCAPSLRLRSDSGEVVEHPAPDGKAFTSRSLAAAIELTERKGREAASWLGGVDVHHVFFEGLIAETDGTYSICWGS